MFVANIWRGENCRIISRCFKTFDDAWRWLDDKLAGCESKVRRWVDEY